MFGRALISPNKVYMEGALLIIFNNSMVDHMVDYYLQLGISWVTGRGTNLIASQLEYCLFHDR